MLLGADTEFFPSVTSQSQLRSSPKLPLQLLGRPWKCGIAFLDIVSQGTRFCGRLFLLRGTLARLSVEVGTCCCLCFRRCTQGGMGVVSVVVWSFRSSTIVSPGVAPSGSAAGLTQNPVLSTSSFFRPEFSSAALSRFYLLVFLMTALQFPDRMCPLFFLALWWPCLGLLLAQMLVLSFFPPLSELSHSLVSLVSSSLFAGLSVCRCLSRPCSLYGVVSSSLNDLSQAFLPAVCSVSSRVLSFCCSLPSPFLVPPSLSPSPRCGCSGFFFGTRTSSREKISRWPWLS